MEQIDAVPPACEEDGNIRYWHCTGCGKYFSDAEGVNEITLEDTVVKATGHEYENGICIHCGKPDPAYGEHPATLTIDPVSACGGDVITVPVRVSNNPGVAAMMIDVAFDPSMLTLTDAVIDESFDGQPTSQSAVNQEADHVTLNWVMAEGQCSENGVFATLTFTVKEQVRGTSKLDITYDPENIFNAAQHNITFAAASGSVTVDKYRRGDLNGDRTVDVKDALMLLEYVTGIDVHGIVGNMDLTGDGRVNNKDVITLLRMAAGL